MISISASSHESRKLSILQAEITTRRPVKRFEDDNKENNKITGTVEEKVNSTLTDKKALLQLALTSLIDTIKSQPGMYSNLLKISSKPTGTLFYQIYSSPSFNGQFPVFQSRCVETYKSMVLDGAEKLYNKMVKELGIGILGDITYANRPKRAGSLNRRD